MVKPVKTEPEFSIEGSKMIAAGISGLMIETTTNASVTVKVASVGKLRSGYYVINESERRDWTGGDIDLGELPDGMYTLSVGGVNETGDSFSAVYQFSVDTEAPSLLITSPQGGGFFDTDSVTVTGYAEAGASVTATVGDKSETVTAARDGSFTVSVSLDVTSAYQDVRLTAEDAAGNISGEYGFTLTNILLGDNDLELVIMIGDEEVTHITAGDGAVKLTLAFKSGSNYIAINENSVAAARINWSSTFISGSGSVSSDGEVAGEMGSVGLVSATLDNYSATVEVIPTSIIDIDATLDIPEGGYVYDGTPKEPEVSFGDEMGLERDVDYTVAYFNNVNAGVATVVISSLDTGKCSGSKTLTFEIAAAPISEAEIALEGKGKDVTVKVTYNDVELTADEDYTLLVEFNEDANAGLVTVTGIGNYTGTKTRAYVLDEKLNEDVGGNETETDPESESEHESETEGKTGDGIETEPDASGKTENETDNTDPDGDNERGWFARNAAWVIPVGVVALGGIGAGVYFLFIKKRYINIAQAIKRLFKGKKEKNLPKGKDEEKRDSE